MVFFTCNACGESLKKAQVDKHVSMCRGCQVLSCIDCGKDFWGDDYKNHNKCISEDQKYGGKGYEAKANKGDVKQQQWIQKVNEAMNKPGISAKLKDVLRQVSTYDNVPRKKAKFQNWIKNSLKINNASLHDEVWNILAAADAAPEVVPQQTKKEEPTAAEVNVPANENEDQNGQANGEKKKKLNKRERKEARQQKSGKATKAALTQEQEEDHAGKKKKGDKKRKHSSEDGDEEQNGCNGGNETINKKMKIAEMAEVADITMSEDTEDQTASKGKFNWKGNIKAVLRDSPDQELSVKKLRKKILAAYYTFTGEGNFKKEEEVFALFNKKINNNPKFRVLKDKVKLVK
ncbi:cell growth-regulating nucleolar protein isoform X1 [Solea solea]|uniref:cell growth-regulating nucleolar protein isoform X1 n=1 Tax=Solea solea TaxID=90069 RepID=UPI00272B70D8|nr:cell growth-regulating nucleolar protein isoform X1 [Solea solea]